MDLPQTTSQSLFDYARLLLAILMLTACGRTQAQPMPAIAPTAPASWIHAEDTAQLLGNRWRLHDAFQHGQPLPFDSLEPVLFSFEETRASLYSARCNYFGAILLPDGARRYRWGESVSTAQQCPPLEGAQESALVTAWVTTNTYTLHQGQLTFSGPDVQIILIIDNTPPTPTPVPTPTPTPAQYPAPA